jgi:prophage tail gpP-like protein
MESPAPNNSPDSKIFGVSCYSIPGILEQSNPPPSAFPLEFLQSNLQEIAQQICDLFGLSVFFDFEPGAKFRKVAIKETEKSLQFLMKLAKQRNFVISDDSFGSLVFWRGLGLGAPVATWDASMSHVNDIQGDIDESSYYSTITGVMPARCKRRKQGKRFTVENPYKTGIIRPLTQEAKDIDEGELETFTQTLAGRMFGAVYKCTVTLSTWLDDDGNLLEPNTTVRLRDPENFIEDYYEFLIRNVTLDKDGEQFTAKVDLVLPSVFSGEIPEELPWQI